MAKFLKSQYCIAFLALASTFLNAMGELWQFSASRFMQSEKSLLLSIVFIGLLVLYKKYWAKKASVFIWILAMFASIGSVLYHLHINDVNHIFQKLTVMRGMILLLLLISNVTLFKCCFSMLAALLIPKEKQHLKLNEVWKLYIFLAFLSLPAYIALYPGSIQWDNGTMLQMAYGLKPLTADNPIFHTGLMYLIKQVASLTSATFAVALYTFIQLQLQNLLFAHLLWRIQKHNVVLRNTLLVFYFALPVFSNYASSLGKDLPFALAIASFSMVLLDMIDTENIQPTQKNHVGLALYSVLLIVLRNIGIYLWLASIVPLLIYLFVQHKPYALRTLVIAIVCLSLTFGLQTIAMQALHITKEKSAANRSIQLQQIARILKVYGKEALSPEEQYAINTVFPIQKAIEKYHSGYADYTKDLFDENASKENITAFQKAYKNIGMRYPLEYIKATYLNSYAYYIPGIHSNLKPEYFYGNNYIENISIFTPKEQGNFSSIYKMVYGLLRRLPLLNVINSSGFSQCLHFAILLFLLFKRKYKYILVMLPILLYGIGLIASPINGYYRYCLPSIYSMGISLAILGKIIKNSQKSI